MIDYTTTALLDYARTVCLTPEADALFTDDRLLALLNGELNSTLVPDIMSVQEEYFVHSEDQSLSNGQTAYDIPERAVGRKIRNISLVDSTGAEFYIQRIYLQDLQFMGATGQDNTGSSWGYSFYLKDDQIILPVPAAPTYVSLRVYYYRKPSNLVAEDNAAQIEVIDVNTNTVTCSAVPGTWVATDTVDAIKGRPGFRSLQDDIEITAISNNDVTLDELPAGLQVGDWISLSGTSPIPQIPYEAFPCLGQLGACKALEAMGDPNIETAWGRYKQMKESLFKMITPRTDSPPQKIISPNNIGNRGWRSGWGWR